MITSISDITEMVYVHSNIIFKPGREDIEMRRRKSLRRNNYSTHLKHIATKLAHKKRIQRVSKLTLNQAARKMRRDVYRMDRMDKDLWDAYNVYYKKGQMIDLMKLKQTDNSVDLLSVRIARTKRYKVWMAAVKMHDSIRISLSRYERGVHPEEISSQLNAYLTFMSRSQTVTTALWIRLQAEDKLHNKLRQMFWSY